MRYLGRIAEQTTLPHIKDIATVEMIGKACKKLLHQQFIDLAFENGEPAEITEEFGISEPKQTSGRNLT
jgi:hypothetical protein